MDLKQVSELLCQIHPRTEHAERTCRVLFERFQHCVEHNVGLTNTARQLQFQDRFVARRNRLVRIQ